MALVFAVFIAALLVVFLHPDGRARRIARLRAGVARAVDVTKSALTMSTETVDRIAADLAEDHRGTGGVSHLLTPSDGTSTDPLEQSASG